MWHVQANLILNNSFNVNGNVPCNHRLNRTSLSLLLFLHSAQFPQRRGVRRDHPATYRPSRALSPSHPAIKSTPTNFQPWDTDLKNHHNWHWDTTVEKYHVFAACNCLCGMSGTKLYCNHQTYKNFLLSGNWVSLLGELEKESLNVVLIIIRN